MVSSFRKKKHSAASQGQEEETGGLFGLEDLIQETIQPKEKEYNTIDNFETIEEQVDNKTVPLKKEYKQSINNIEQESKFIEDNEDESQGFDLRSAVIYSEILNRKTF